MTVKVRRIIARICIARYPTEADVLHLIAAGLLAILGWSAFVLISPYRRCRWCRGKRRGRGCWRCKGRRDVRRLGARLVHKIKLAIGQAWTEREWRR